MPVSRETIGNWDPAQLIRFVRDILENQPSTSFQSLKVDQLEVVRQLLLRDELTVTKDNRLHKVGMTGEPSWEHSWAVYSAGTAIPGFWKDALGFVHIQGVIASGTVGQSAFTLPPGYRPDKQYPFPAVSNGAIGRVDVFSDGTVVPASPSSNVWVTLNGITFPAA